ncbi:SDR family NAD(P)-dependent oxidoreductase [Labrys sp. KNU-23]|uniref:SDR family NAD(P)-dependent oxidoreductase n=1 Tax=Labrys sp. KNU-23 TaxID=2789216 RepID=UPI00165B9ED0
MGQVRDKITIITSGASGIGAACAETLASEGTRAIVTDVDASHGKEAVAGIEAERMAIKP